MSQVLDCYEHGDEESTVAWLAAESDLTSKFQMDVQMLGQKMVSVINELELARIHCPDKINPETCDRTIKKLKDCVTHLFSSGSSNI